jgi:hypothetical protein|tara:strand:- start:228 stop:401 length:174 start_codon:yes stop_codon:yes gene_type:complete
MELQVEIKNVYGVERIYPINETALNFSHLIRKKTLEQNDINLIKKLGFKIKVITKQL